MEKQIFVAREQELAQLQGFLKRALASQGLVCFVTGEAGSGKTTLVTEFARRAQEQYADLAVAIGQSDAQTGAGDANLPFREILGQLTGDVEAKLAQGAITQENASRLRKLLVLSGQALVEVGPDLIGVLVPGAGLAARVGAFAADKVGWLDKLEKLVGKPREGTVPGDSGIRQSHIFEQYTNVLGKLSGKRPLLLVLDDLQWADTASIELLFRLGRRIGGQRILLVGTYRPEEVAIGRAGERHPLEKVLAEFKRYYGDIWVDLHQSEQAKGQEFVNAYLNSEPNQLEEEFRQKLYQHTGGHALFTVELMRSMQERGDLVQDEQGRWVVSPALDWQSLPKRVEGVIEERIGRLGQELRQMLTVGSVQGEDFIAEVVARVQAADAGGLIRRLSTELERQHRLIIARGVQRLEQVGQRLSLYRFQHNMFQKYLYNDLDEAERAYLHEDVGNALEELYGDQVDEIAVQLARHFEEAGVTKKARTYLEKAGRQAAVRFANEEAIAYFSRAFDQTPESEPNQRYSLLIAREQVYNLQGKRDLQAQDLATLESLVNTLESDHKRIELALRKANYAYTTSDYPAAITAAREAISLSEATQDIYGQAIGHYEWGISGTSSGDKETAHFQLEQAQTLSHKAGLWQVEASSLRGLGILNVNLGDYGRAKTYYEQSLFISREQGDRCGESETLKNLGVVSDKQGDYAKAKNYYMQALPVFHETGDRRSEARLFGNLGVICFQQGDLRATRAYYEQSLRISHEIGDRESESRMLGNLGALSATLGDLAAARCYFEQALVLVREIGRRPGEVNILSNLGFALAQLGDYSAASNYCSQSLQLARELGNRWSEANALRNIGDIRSSLGDYSTAQDHYDACLEIARSIGYRLGEADVLANLGLLYHHMGEDQAALEACQRALEIAQELGNCETEAYTMTCLGHALAGLGYLADASSAYQRGLDLRRKLGQPVMTVEPLAGLARVRLSQQESVEAMKLVEEILSIIESHSLVGVDEPILVYLTCNRVLMVNQDLRAKCMLNTAYKMLQERSAKIEKEELRRSYLENVAVHRELVQEYAKTE
jgi:adenylate cyclase